MVKAAVADPHARANLRGLDTHVSSFLFSCIFLLTGRFTQTGGKTPVLTEV